MSAVDEFLAGPIAAGLLRDEDMWFRLIAMDGTLLYVSPRVKDFLGHTAEDLTGTDVNELTHPDERHMGPAAGKAMLESAVHAVYRLRKKDGEYAWVSTYAKFMDGFILALGRDVPERVRGARWEPIDDFV